MSAVSLSPTTVYEKVAEGMRHNDAVGWPGTYTVVATGMPCMSAAEAESQPPRWDGVAWPATGESIYGATKADVGSFGYYIAVLTQKPSFGDVVDEWPFLFMADAYPSAPIRVTLGVRCLSPAAVVVETVESQRQERRATARLAQQVRDLLPGMS